MLKLIDFSCLDDRNVFETQRQFIQIGGLYWEIMSEVGLERLRPLSHPGAAL